LLTLCSTPATTTTAAPATTSESAAAQQYLADIAPYNAAVSTAQTALNSATEMSQLPAIIGPAVTAMQNADNLLLRQQWPAGVRQDIKTKVAADGAVIGDLTSLETANASDASSIEANIGRDANASAADANIVRSDLGLPPPPGS
jgi:hypothetical protein